jgi:PAS domain S-box-containing protein
VPYMQILPEDFKGNTMRESIQKEDLYFLQGGGEMGKMIRSHDWKNTPLGDPSGWPLSLRTMVGVMLDNPFGMYIAWGPEYTQLYNDGYRPILGSTKHPQALGISTRETFSEIWHIIGSMFEGVMNGIPVGFPDFMLPLNRHGFVEECFFDFSYSPIRKEDGGVGGVLVTVIETTNKKKSEEALKSSEERFRTLADNIPNLAWMAHADGSLFWYNKKWYEYTGTTSEQMEGWGWQTVHDPEQLPFVIENWKKSIASGGNFEMIFPLRGADGKYRQFLTRVLPMKDADGKIYQWFGTNTDITAQIEAEQKLLESKERLKSVVDSAPFPIGVYIGEKMIIEMANQAMLDVYGKGSDVLGKSYMDLLPELESQLIFTQLQNVYRSGRPLHVKNQRLNILASGEMQSFYFNYSFTPLFDAAGKVYGIVNTGADVTDLNIAKLKVQQSESSLRHTILHAPVAMCIFKGIDFKVELANERMIELWGKPAEQVIDKPIFVALPEAKEQGFEKILERVYQTGEAYSAEAVPITLPRKEGLQMVYVNFVYEAFREAEGEISGILAVAVDVTAQVLARQKIEEVVANRTTELAAANSSLQKSNAELEQFAYIASHDLQEPLRKISTFTQMLEHRASESLDEQSKIYLSKITNSSGRMRTLIHDVLTYSAVIKETEGFMQVDLNEIAKSICTDYELLIEQKQAYITYNTLPVIEAIPLQMSQLLSNLIGNSLKYTKNEGKSLIRITASLASAEEKAVFGLNLTTDYYKIEFRDNGIGFEEEHSERIFHIFQRLHHKTEYEGTGIGLTLCKKIVLNHHGEINARGSSAEGAVFTVFLPVKQMNSPLSSLN